MNEKTAKKLRKLARTALKSSALKGPDRQHFMLTHSTVLGATHKQAKRAVRVVSEIFRQKAPIWAVQQFGIKGRVGLFPKTT